MNEGKSIVLSTILRFEKAFTVAQVFQLSGLSRELTRYHIQQFTKDGFLEKADKYYHIVNRDGLLDLIKNHGSASEKKAHPTVLYGDVNLLNETAMFLVATRVLRVPGYLEMKHEFVRWLDETIEMLREVRQFTNTKGYGDKQAAKIILQGDSLEAWFATFEKQLAPYMSMSEFINGVNHKIEQIED